MERMKLHRRTGVRKVAVIASFLLVLIGVKGNGPFLDLWMTRNQQGRSLFEKGLYLEAAQRYKDPLWKGLAYYAAQDFEAAISQFAQVPAPNGLFNLGNAYAHTAEYETAAEAYEQALKLRPDYADAQFNLELIHLLIESQQIKPDEEGPPGDPTYSADEIKIDERGEKGKAGEIEQAQLSDKEIAEIWLRQVQTSPADFLRLKFAYQLLSDGR